MTRSDQDKPKRRRRRRASVEGEIRRTARQIYDNGMAEAMRAATLMIVARKLDEIRNLLSGIGVTMPEAPVMRVQPAQQAPAPAKNPCVQCGRQGVYRTKVNRWNKTGSWFCRAHMALGVQDEAEDRMDQVVSPAPTPSLPSLEQPAGASSLSEAMGLAQIEES